MAFFELINLNKVRKAILYLACVILALWLQTIVFSRLGLLGANPFFLPALVVAIGMFEGGVWGGLLGLVVGIGCDLAMSDSTVMFLILFTVFGFVSGMLAQFFINRTFFAFLLLSVVTLVITAFFQILPLCLFHGTALRPLLATAGLQVLWSLPLAVLSFAAVKFIAGRERSRL